MKTVIRNFSDATSSSGLGIQETFFGGSPQILWASQPLPPLGMNSLRAGAESVHPGISCASSEHGWDTQNHRKCPWNAWRKAQHMRDTDKIVLIPYSFQIHRALPGYHPLCSQIGPRASPYPGGTQGSVQGIDVDAASPRQNKARALQRGL